MTSNAHPRRSRHPRFLALLLALSTLVPPSCVRIGPGDFINIRTEDAPNVFIYIENCSRLHREVPMQLHVDNVEQESFLARNTDDKYFFALNLEHGPHEFKLTTPHQKKPAQWSVNIDGQTNPSFYILVLCVDARPESSNEEDASLEFRVEVSKEPFAFL